jgi:hypothetical protein
MEQKIPLRTDPTMRALAVAGMGAIAIIELASYRLGGGGSILSYGVLALIGAAALIPIPWSASIDGDNVLRLPGLNQRNIPLASVREIRPSGRFVEIVWHDASRERVKRVYPKDAPGFAKWLNSHAGASGPA